ncbi:MULTISPECIES: Lrp/AsnC family transcriptional regulator [unclassified Acidiplasma]|uniref:Lrp/AsnC family transcriptional regulator n=1 Tax=unclassified Acidiplasma TaxID=2641301 RepID=UPI0006960814|nr:MULTISPECIES: Lrp/AsnC family transcriptional regulator [unclassified Acidiplasma]WMT54772.1 MAG: Lrp/AsnC family transcriptional regulator [Acidiplasma sp.]
MVDEFDRRILTILKNDCDVPLKEIGKKVGLFSASAISKRINKLKEDGIIKKQVALLDYEKLNFDFISIIFVKTKYHKDYAQIIGDKLKSLPNVVAVFFILGDIDFVILTVNRNRQDFLRIMEKLTSMDEIERSDSRVVAYTIKDIDFSSIEL